MVLPLIVVKGSGPSLLGRNWINHITLDWKTIFHVQQTTDLTSLVKKHPQLFQEELGCLKSHTVSIPVNRNSQPRFFKARSVSLFLKEKVEEELQRLQDLKIISSVPHSKWATPIVPVAKPDGKVRICGDYKITVNPNIKTDAYPLPRVEELFAGGTIFTTLDLTHAYLQLELDKESQEPTTIVTHKGLFQYHRLPFGISAAPAIFQRTLETLLSGILNVCIYLDDILVSGKSVQDHAHTLSAVFNRLEEAGLTLKASKCRFGLPRISYLGHVIDKDGLHPAPEKVEAITKAPAPRNVKELRDYVRID